MLSAAPLTGATLAARLRPLWDSPAVSAEAAVEVVSAIKKLARSEALTAAGPAEGPAASVLLRRAYGLPRLLQHLKSPALEHQVFIVEPRPQFLESLALLKQAGRNAYWISLRTALQRSQFLDAFKIVDMYPPGLQVSVYPFAVGLASCTPWLPTPVAAVIASCWIGLAAAAYSTPQFKRVRWQSKVSLRYRLLNWGQLKMANMLVEFYEDLATDDVYSPSTDRLIARALDQRGIDVLPSTTSQSSRESALVGQRQRSTDPEYTARGSPP